jgi:sugar phosphate permease
MQQQKTFYRGIVIATIFLTAMIAFAGRVNISVILPTVKEEFLISNFEAGALFSFFFLGYVATQLPAGYWLRRCGARGTAALMVLGFSVMTCLIGTAGSVAALKFYRFGLGFTQGPATVSYAVLINNWFPPQEKGLAVGVYLASLMIAPILVPPLCVWIMLTYGWREVLYLTALPGFVMAAVWYIVMRTTPEESPRCSTGELAHIRAGCGPADADRPGLLTTGRQVFTSWNIWGDTLAYLLFLAIFYGLMTWVPSYLVTAKQYSFARMGVVAAAPWLGGALGVIFGGWLSDRVFAKRRKPSMLITCAATAVMMFVIPHAPDSPAAVAAVLFAAGFLLNIGFSAFTAYPMALTNQRTYPLAIGLVNGCGNIGGFFSPMIAGHLLDTYSSYTAVFIFFALCAAAASLILLTINEPVEK